MVVLSRPWALSFQNICTNSKQMQYVYLVLGRNPHVSLSSTFICYLGGIRQNITTPSLVSQKSKVQAQAYYLMKNLHLVSQTVHHYGSEVSIRGGKNRWFSERDPSVPLQGMIPFLTLLIVLPSQIIPGNACCSARNCHSSSCSEFAGTNSRHSIDSYKVNLSP